MKLRSWLPVLVLGAAFAAGASACAEGDLNPQPLPPGPDEPTDPNDDRKSETTGGGGFGTSSGGSSGTSGAIGAAPDNNLDGGVTSDNDAGDAGDAGAK